MRAEPMGGGEAAGAEGAPVPCSRWLVFSIAHLCQFSTLGVGVIHLRIEATLRNFALCQK